MQVEIRQLRGQRLQGLGVEFFAATRRVVDEADPATMAFVGQGAQHRDHRRDAAPGADQQHAIRALLGHVKDPVRLAEPDRGAHRRPLFQVAGHPTARRHGHRELQLAGGIVLGLRRRKAALRATAIDLDAQADELTGPETGPGGVRPNPDTHAAGGGMFDGGDPAGDPVGREQRVDLLEIAIDAVRVGQARHQIGAQSPLQPAG